MSTTIDEMIRKIAELREQHDKAGSIFSIRGEMGIAKHLSVMKTATKLLFSLDLTDLLTKAKAVENALIEVKESIYEADATLIDGRHPVKTKMSTTLVCRINAALAAKGG
jgi:hypothetical protein